MDEKELYLEIKSFLDGSGITNPLEAETIFAVAVGHLRIFIDGDKKVDDLSIQTARRLVKRRVEGYPLQYIARSWPFMQFELSVGEGVLIPRPETEDLCEYVLNLIEPLSSPRVLDLCSGTGCLAIAIKQARQDAMVTALEFYNEAFQFLLENINSNSLEIDSVQDDVFGYEKALNDDTIDLIVCNPPYVSLNEYHELQKELHYEPQQALTDNSDGMRFYRYIAREYKVKLKENGYIAFEITPIRAEEVEEILIAMSYRNVQIAKDRYGEKRIISAQR